FHLVMFANRVHAHLMPTDLFVRRPLLWLQLASQMRASILCSPNFGYRHYLKVLGERSPEGLDLSAVPSPSASSCVSSSSHAWRPADCRHTACFPSTGWRRRRWR